MSNQDNSRQVIALVGFAAFAAGLIGFITLPLVNNARSLTEIDDSLIGPVLIYLLLVLGCAAAGMRVPFVGGLAAGLAVPVTIAMAIATVLGIVLTRVFTGSVGMEWGAGALMAFVVTGGGVLAIAVAQAGWPGSWEESNPVVATLGSVASFVTIAGLFAPSNGLTYADTLGFSTHAGVGLGVLAFAAILALVPVLGFIRGRWGAGLLVGYLGYIALSFGLSRAEDPGKFSSLGGLEPGQEYHPAAALGFWSMVGLAAIHTAITFGSASASGSSAAAGHARIPGAPPASIGPAVWAPDPYGQHEHRYFDGQKWTTQVADAGVSSRGAADFRPPPTRAADWYPDPSGYAEHRYFDGRRWTNKVSTGGVASVYPAVAAPPGQHSATSAAIGEGSPSPTDAAGASRSHVANQLIEPPPPPPDDAPAPAPPAAVVDERAASAWAPDESGTDDFDDRTVSRPAAALFTSPTSPGWTVADRSGNALDLSRAIVIGRDPAPHDALPGAQLLTVGDRTVSKTHAAFGTDGQGVWVMDLHSKNGVTIAADPPIPVEPLTRHRLADGDVVVVGDITVFSVSR